MPANKTLYVRDDDLVIWDRAESYAKATRQSVSALVAEALGNYLPDGDGLEEIRIDVGNPRVIKIFTGRWLVRPDIALTRTRHPEYDPGLYWGVAQTRRGSIAVCRLHEQFSTALEVYEDLAAAKRNGVPPDIIAMAAAELRSHRHPTVVHLDI